MDTTTTVPIYNIPKDSSITSVHTDVSNRESHDRSEAAMIRLLQSIRDDLNPRRNMIDDIT